MAIRVNLVSCALLIGAAASCADHESTGEGSSRLGTDLLHTNPKTPPSVSLAKGFEIGSVAGVLGALRAENTRTTRRYRFPENPLGQPSAIVEHFFDEAGQLSMTGRLADSHDSEFILKADPTSVYGWMVDRERDVAFEYTTNESGSVVVKQVEVEDIFPVCNLIPPDALPEMHEAPPRARMLVTPPEWPPHIGEYDGISDVRTLQSLPGAEKVWYIDLSEVMNGSEPIGQTREDVWRTWQSLAATVSSFKLNVTTDPAVYEEAGTANSGRACMRDVDEGSSSCGLNIIGSRSCCNVNRYRNGYDTGRILAHEVGHGLGMLHDGGDDGGEYFNGFSEFQWTPLMGNVWPGTRWDEALYQWSKGEYTSATRQEDDFANINRHVEYRDDDIPESVALNLEGTSVAMESNWGQIARNTDSDGFTFSIGAAGGRAELRIDRIEYIGGAMLDVAARIEDASGMLMAEANAEVARYAEIEVDLPAGDYTLVVHGGAEGTPARGFSNYSSVGFYAIAGTITGATDSGTDGAGGMGGSTGAGGATATGAGGGGGAAVGGTPGMGGTTTSAGGLVGGAADGSGGSSATSGTGTTTAQGGATGTVTTTGASTTGALPPSTSDATGTATASGSGSTLGGAVATTGNTTTAAGGPASPPPAESGCACRTNPSPGRPLGLALTLLGVAALALRRRQHS